MKNVLVIAYYFPPLGWSGVQRTLKFIKYLRFYKWNPIVVTVKNSNFKIMDYTLENEINKDIKIIRINDLKLKDITDSMQKKLLSYINCAVNIIDDEKLKKQYINELEIKFNHIRNTLLIPDGSILWAENVTRELQKKIDLSEIDAVITTSGPYSAHIAGLYIKNNFDIPWIAEFRDQWLNNPYYNYDKESIKYNVEKNMERQIICACDKIITTTSISRENFIKEYDIADNKITVITNGYDEEDFQDIKDYKCNDKFTICHNGSFYLLRNPYSLMEVIRECIDQNKINKDEIQIILNGKSENGIVENMKNILGKFKFILEYNGYIPHKSSLKIAKNADVLLAVCGRDERCREVYTGKIFEYIRLKRPILVISPNGSLAEQLVKETECGVNIEYDNKKELKNYIIKQYNLWKEKINTHIRAGNIEKYERRNLTEKLAHELNTITK